MYTEYNVLSARTKGELSTLLSQKMKEGWQLYGELVIIEPELGGDNAYTQAIVRQGEYLPTASTNDPEYYYVLVTAGQSNNMATGEGIPLPDSYDRPDPRIKQMARRNKVTPYGEACAYNDIIPADHCLHDVEDISNLNHPKATKEQYGCVGHGLHIAKRLLPYVPINAGILIVPCSRGGSAFTDSKRKLGEYKKESGATGDSSLWGVDRPLYMDLIARTKAALSKNPKNVLLAVYWMQGEGDCMSTGYQQQPEMFLQMVERFRLDLSEYAGQCLGESAARVPWLCGDTTYWWKTVYPEQYNLIYGNYRNNADKNIHFVELMKDEAGRNVPTNNPVDDPDVPEANYYGAASRTSANWTNQTRAMHFSSWARRGIIPDRIASAILEHAGRNGPFLRGEDVSVYFPEPYKQKTEKYVLYSGSVDEGNYESQNWELSAGSAEAVLDPESTSWRGLKLSQSESSKDLKISHDVTNAPDLLKNGGKISLRFKLTGEHSANKIAFAMHLQISESSLNGLVFDGKADSTHPCLLAFFLQTDKDRKLNLMYRTGSSSKKVGGFGDLNNGWHTLDFVYPGKGKNTVIPYVDSVECKETLLTWVKFEGEDNKLIITDESINDTYVSLIDGLVVEINEPEI
ncbi:TPA: DUF1737 domain-containing protein [Escherichia coli]|nr:DUF1737 domain-containing protein [Escherichia coli]